MADKFGALELPVPQSNSGPDPALAYIADYCKAVLNATAGAAWASVGMGEPCKYSFAHDPERYDVRDKDFPSVWVWRESGEEIQLADDWQTDKAMIEVLWVFPPAPQGKQAKRLPFFNGVIKSLMRALKYGRHPSWTLNGDTDATAATRGSLLWKHACFYRHFVRRPMTSGLSVQLFDGGTPISYDAVKITIEAEELLVRDPKVGTWPSKHDGEVGDLDISTP
jgi:hypothetical protein